MMFLIGCGGASTPQRTAADYEGAVKSGASERAWRLHTQDYRASVSRDRFESDFERRVEAAADVVPALEHASNSDASLTAELPYSEYETVELAFVDGAWRITAGVGQLYSQSTPRETIVSFIRAVEAGNAAALMPLVPPEFRAQMSEADLERWLDESADDLAQTVALLKSSVDGPIYESGDSATIRYGASTMTLRRESGRWLIEDF